MNWSKLIRQLEPLVIEANKSGLQKSKADIISLLESYNAQKNDFQRYVHFHDDG